MLASGVDWTNVLILGVPAYIAAVGGAAAAIIAARNRRSIRIPSGGTIGETMERTHDLSAADVGLTKGVHELMHRETERREAPEGG